MAAHRCAGPLCKEGMMGLMISDDGKRAPGVGDEVEVVIEAVAFGGDGVARHDGYVLFVPDVIPGERVRARITAAKRSYGRGVPVRIVEPSADRIEPRCGVYGVCGGCQYQHVSYERSLEFKEQQLKEVALRIGGLVIDDTCDPIRPAPEAYGYRTAVSLGVRNSGNAWEAGYFARDNETFVPISQCPIASEEINQVLAKIHSVLGHLDHPDQIKNITIKSAGKENLFYPGYRGPFRFQPDEVLVYRLGQLVFHFGPTTFFQVNHAMIPVLLDLVGEGLHPGMDETLLDLYAGVGLFSIALAKRYRQVFGIETGREAVTCFQENIEANNLRNVTVIRGTVEGTIEDARREMGGRRVSVVVDPPRMGLKDDVIRFLIEAPVGRLVYVSCDPATLARDIKRLAPSYRLRKITPIDMFPQTKHMETVAVLERIDAS
jgi:23S rRNA (uracil1939-C5)-methyltransferase